MPASQPHAPPSKVPAVTKALPSAKQDSATLDAIHAILDRMRAVLPADPYMLTIPQDEPRYHHWSQQSGSQWLDHTPFEHREPEHMQYQTFHFLEPGKEMFVQHNTYLEEARRREKIMAKTGGSQRPGTAEGGTPMSAGPVKKMSLGAYKRKKTEGIKSRSTSPPTLPKDVAQPKQAAVKGPAERVKKETEQVLAAVADAEAEKQFDAVRAREQTDKKRKREDEKRLNVEEEKRGGAKKYSFMPEPLNAALDDDLPTAKKARTNAPAVVFKPGRPPEERAEAHLSIQPSSPPSRTTPGTVLPPKLSPLQTPLLPPRLSPTLPANIAAAADARKQRQGHAAEKVESKAERIPSKVTLQGKRTSGTIINEDRLAPGKAEGIPRQKSPAPRNGFRATSNSSAVRAELDEKLTGTSNNQNRKRSPVQDAQSGEDDTSIRPRKEDETHRPSLLVKLKFDRNARKNVQALLRLSPRPRGDMSASGKDADKEQDDDEVEEGEVRSDADTTGNSIIVQNRRRVVGGKSVGQKGVAQKVVPTPKLTQKGVEPKKRPPTTDNIEAPPVKRQKVLEPLKKNEPSTPTPPGPQSPVVSKVQRLTPTTRKDHLMSAPMKREKSTDSNVPTPSAQSAGTPSVNSQASHGSQANGVLKPLAGYTSSRTTTQIAWENEQNTLLALGRELKHASTAHIQAATSKSPQDADYRRLAAVTALESLLCYFIAFTCSDQAQKSVISRRPANVKTWTSLTGFFKLVKAHCEPFPVLSGLAAALGMVFNSHILYLSTLHAAFVASASNVPSEDVPSPVFSRSDLLETFASVHREAHLAATNLDLDTIQRQFPKTWAARNKSPAAANAIPAEDLQPGKLACGRGFAFPFGVYTPPIQAARAGVAMLQEWIPAHDVAERVVLDGKGGASSRTRYALKLRLS